MRSRTLLLSIAALGLAAGCSHGVGSFVWADDYRDPATDAEYVITPGDLLNVRVFNQEGVSGRVRVRGDGKISLPFLNDVEAAGLTPAALARRLQVRLKEFINNPVVTVLLEEPAPIQISVLGEVAKPGAYRVESGAGILQTLALAGGLGPYAGRDRIFVLRKGTSAARPTVTRIRFDYESLSRATGRGASFRMRDGDVLVVE
jgi:polysaccharide export outer membrane protein